MIEENKNLAISSPSNYKSATGLPGNKKAVLYFL